MGRQPDHLNIAQRARLDRIPGRPVAGVESALETDLDEDAGPLHMLDDGVGGREVQGDRLFTERCDGGVGRHVEELRVGRGRCRDHQRVDAGVEECLWTLHLLGAHRPRHLCRPRLVGVDHREPGDEWALLQAARVQRADPPGPD